MDAVDKIMFEIFRDPGSGGRYEVLYLTELDERDRDQEIGRALRGTHFLDGFLSGEQVDRGKEVIAAILERLNRDEKFSVGEAEAILRDSHVLAGDH